MIVTCINCHEQILETVEEIHLGDTVMARQFKGINGYPDPTTGLPAICPHCDYDIKPSVERILGL